MAKSKSFLYVGEEIIYTSKVDALKDKLEVVRCKNDIIYFAEKYCHIISANGKELIKLREYQRDFLTNQLKYTRYMLMCSRQVGKTTVAAVAIAHFLLFNPFKFTALVSKDKSGSKEILEKVRVLYSMLPKFLQRAVVSFGKEHAEFADEVRIKPFPAQSDEIRGFAIDYLYLDEFAFLHQNVADTFLTGVMPTITSRKSARLLITTTPKGSNHFEKMWDQAMFDPAPEDVRRGVFKKAMVTWKDIPEYDADWAAAALAGLGGDKNLFRQEFECEFINHFNTSLFKMVQNENWWMSKEKTSIKVKKLDKDIFDSMAHEDADLAYFYKSQKLLDDPEECFIGGLDTAGGLKNDYTVFNVFWLNKKERRYEQFFKYSVNDITPRDYPAVLDYMLKKMLKRRVDWLAIENNAGGGGEEVINRLLDMDDDYYSGILYADSSTEKKEMFGVRTTQGTKKKRLSIIKHLLKQNKMIIHDENTLSELCAFIQKGKKFEGVNGSHDDEVSSLWQMAESIDDDRYYDYFNKITKSKPKEEVVQEIQKYISKTTVRETSRDRTYKNPRLNYDESGIVIKDDTYLLETLAAQSGAGGRRGRRRVRNR